jgi:hypothetical protein
VRDACGANEKPPPAAVTFSMNGALVGSTPNSRSSRFASAWPRPRDTYPIDRPLCADSNVGRLSFGTIETRSGRWTSRLCQPPVSSFFTCGSSSSTALAASLTSTSRSTRRRHGSSNSFAKPSLTSRHRVGYYNEDRVHTRTRDAPFGRPAEKRPSATARVIRLPRVGGLQHRYAWADAA